MALDDPASGFVATGFGWYAERGMGVGAFERDFARG